MPLYKRKPFCQAGPPQDLEPHERVFQIRFTGEIFRDYQEYLNRLNLYRQKVWTCKVTGKTNLTYEEALTAEKHASEKVQQFPEALVAPVLRMIQYSTLGLSDLVNAIYMKLQGPILEGMELQGRKEQIICACNILEVLEDGDTIQYKVGWIDKDKKITDTTIVNTEDLIRKKPPVSRSILKAFIRESTSRSAPWVVLEKLAKKHGILSEPPEELKEYVNKDGQNLKINKKRKEKEAENGKLTGADATKKKRKTDGDKPNEVPVKYPIDDLLVPAADDPHFTDRPSLSTDFSVPMNCVGDLLMVWNFCSSFSRLLNLWPFTLENFENALCHKESNLILIAESHLAILHLLIKDEGDYYGAIRTKKRKAKVSLTKWTEYLCDFLEMDDRQELSSHVSTIQRGHYGLLDINVKLAILRELVAEALTTDAIRDKLDECMEQQQALVAMKKEGGRKKKEEQHPKKEESMSKEMNHGNMLENGTENMHDSDVGVMSPNDGAKPSSKKNHMLNNGKVNCNVANSREVAMSPRMENEVCSDRRKTLSGVKDSMKGKKRRKDENKETLNMKLEEEHIERLEREMEKLAIRVNPIGKDRNYSRYWFFRREGRLFVESSDSKQWGYYSTKEELEALMGSLNSKGEREKALKKQLEKYYHRISAALQKRAKDMATKFLLHEADLRRSTRVRSQPRVNPAMTVFKYVNKWRE